MHIKIRSTNSSQHRYEAPFVFASLVHRPLPAFQCCMWKNGRPFQCATLKCWEGPGDESYVLAIMHASKCFCVNLLITSELCLSSTTHFILSIRVLRLKVSQTLISAAQRKAVHWWGLIGRGREENGDKSQLYAPLIFNLKVVALFPAFINKRAIGISVNRV